MKLAKPVKEKVGKVKCQGELCYDEDTGTFLFRIPAQCDPKIMENLLAKKPMRIVEVEKT